MKSQKRLLTGHFGHKTLRHQDTLGHFGTDLKTLRHRKRDTRHFDTSVVIEENPGHFDPGLFLWDTAPPVICVKLRHQFCGAEVSRCQSVLWPKYPAGLWRCVILACFAAWQEAECLEMIDASAKFDGDYGHLFDWTLINDDLDVAVSELRQLARAVETEPFWVPASWMRWPRHRQSMTLTYWRDISVLGAKPRDVWAIRWICSCSSRWLLSMHYSEAPKSRIAKLPLQLQDPDFDVFIKINDEGPKPLTCHRTSDAM